MSAFVYWNGSIIPESEAAVGIHDGAWLHGAGLFETMLAENGRIFRLEAHVERLRKSAEKLLRPIEREVLPTRDRLEALLSQNAHESARVRLTVSSGSMRGSEADQAPPWTICATTAPLTEYPSSLYETGIHVIICPYKQNVDDPIVGHKVTAYLSRLMGLRRAQEARCMEAIWFTTKNELAEGSIANVFLVRGGVLYTPPLETPVLPGIVRATVLELARKLDIVAEERRLFIADLLDAGECFLTNSIQGIMPVIRVERHDVGDGLVGTVTTKLRQAYRDLVKAECAGSPRPP
ncbi:MAG: aminotransferase class IV [Planctomycetota bacterium]